MKQGVMLVAVVVDVVLLLFLEVAVAVVTDVMIGADSWMVV